MVTVTLSSDYSKRWAICFTILSICVYSHSLRLFGFKNKFHQKRLNISSCVQADEKWIEQPIDHFNNSDTRTWKMRYFERLDLWKENSPVYVYINGEVAATDYFINYGIIVDLATDTNGALYLTEHRYYGKSKPFDTFTTKTLAFLSSTQALADVANFVKQIKRDTKFKDSKVIVVGGSYAGNLAAWFKLLYPDLADAVISSSAPVLAKKDFYEYVENVGDDFKKYGSQECYNKINETFNRYEQLLQTSEGQAQLKNELDICASTDLSKDLNKQLFFLDKASLYMNKVQYDTPEEIKEVCEDLPEDISEGRNEFWNEQLGCIDYDFENSMASFRDTEMPWTYQTCTEFGYFITTTSGRHPFTNNIHVNLYTSICTALYGSDFNEKTVDEGVKNTNEMYGGLQPNVHHVVFVNGDMDPYHKLGVLKDLSPDAPARLISGSSHCNDLSPIDPSDPEEVAEAKKYVMNLIKTWIRASESIKFNGGHRFLPHQAAPL